MIWKIERLMFSVESPGVPRSLPDVPLTNQAEESEHDQIVATGNEHDHFHLWRSIFSPCVTALASIE